jgi:hypothetical protein
MNDHWAISRHHDPRYVGVAEPRSSRRNWRVTNQLRNDRRRGLRGNTDLRVKRRDQQLNRFNIRVVVAKPLCRGFHIVNELLKGGVLRSTTAVKAQRHDRGRERFSNHCFGSC